MTDTQQRFLRAIAERLSPGRVVELHLFPSIRQGGNESGVAVVAVEELTPIIAPTEAELANVDVDDEPSMPELASPLADVVIDPFDDPEVDALDAAAFDDASIDADDEFPDVAESEPDEDISIDVYPAADLAAPEPDDDEDLVLDAVSLTDPAEPEQLAPAMTDERHQRLTVYAARYRLAVKGPDRGKWECEVVAEADAPLDSVSAVVRGVQRRVGDSGEAIYFTGDAFRAALIEPAWSSAS